MAGFFRYKEHWVKWIVSSPANRASICDRCGRRVERDEPRLCVDDDLGPARIRGRGKRHSYLCEDCARNVPNRPMEIDQETFEI